MTEKRKEDRGEITNPDKASEGRVGQDADLVTSGDEFIGKSKVRLDIAATSDGHNEDSVFS